MKDLEKEITPVKKIALSAFQLMVRERKLIREYVQKHGCLDGYIKTI